MARTHSRRDIGVTLVGLLTLPGYRPGYNDQKFIPKDIPEIGYEAAARHFPPSAMMAPDVLLVETNHDLRNPADFLVLEKLAKAVLAVPGISTVQAITRPREPRSSTRRYRICSVCKPPASSNSSFFRRSA